MNINWYTVERFLVHVLLIGLGAAFVYIEQWVTGHNFGQYQILAMAVNGLVFNFVEKFFINQGVVLNTSTLPPP
jgi:hypothetical protein